MLPQLVDKGDDITSIITNQQLVLVHMIYSFIFGTVSVLQSLKMQPYWYKEGAVVTILFVLNQSLVGDIMAY